MVESEKDLVTDSTEVRTDGEDNSIHMYEKFRDNPWFLRVAGVIAVVIIILIIIFGVRAIHHHLDNNKKSTSGTAQTTKRPGGATGSGSSKTSGSSTANGSGSHGAALSKPQTTGPGLKNGQQLTDTGPGDVAAIFLAASLAAAGLHYLIDLRRKA